MNKDGKIQGVSLNYFKPSRFFVTNLNLHAQKIKKGRQFWWRIDGYLGEMLVIFVEVKDCDGIMWYKILDFEKGVCWVEGEELKFKRPSEKW